jgi:hypothetical protein
MTNVLKHKHDQRVKTAVYRTANTIMQLEKGKDVVFGGVCKAEDVPKPSSKYSPPPAKSPLLSPVTGSDALRPLPLQTSASTWAPSW